MASNERIRVNNELYKSAREELVALLESMPTIEEHKAKMQQIKKKQSEKKPMSLKEDKKKPKEQTHGQIA